MIVHFDMDAFYASVEQRDDPSLQGVPLAVAGGGRRSVLLTASYEARPFGVRSAMPLYQALERCPGLVVVPPDFARYREASRQVFAIMADGAAAVEGLSLDEAFVAVPELDVAGARVFAERVRARIRAEVGLTASAGVAAVKMVAKIASDANKPNGLTVVAPGEERAFLAPLPVGRLWGIGPKTLPRVQAFGIVTIGDVAVLDDAQAYRVFGRSGRFFRDLACGIDERTVDGSRERKSISTEETFERDVRDEARIRTILAAQAAELADDLRGKGMRAATIGIKAKRADFSIVVRQTTLASATNDAAIIRAAALACWERAGMRDVPLRLIGTRVAELTTEVERELRLFS
jgi:DNA polymerase-4